MKTFACIAAAASLLIWSVPVAAQFAKPEDAIKYRQSAMFIQGQHMGRLGAMVNGRVPFDAAVAADNAALVAEISKLAWPAFGPGTDKGGNTRAKGEIWSEPAKFKETSDKLVAETAKLAAAAKSGNLDNLKIAFKATADTCQTCHDAFRNK